MRLLFLLGLGPLVAAKVVKRKEKVKAEIKRNEPDKITLAQQATIALQKVQQAEFKLEAVIRTVTVAEAQAPNGKAAMVAAAEADVLARINMMTNAQIQLNADNDDLAVKGNVLEVKRAELESATDALNTAFLAWLGTDASEAAEKLKAQISLLTATAYALISQISGAPAKAGDDMAVHLSVLTLWKLRIQTALISYSTARAALAVGVLAPAVALAAAGATMVAVVNSTALSVDDFVLTANTAQISSLMAANAQAQLDGANKALDALNATGSPRSALTGAAKEREDARAKASRAQRSAAMAALTQAMRQRTVDAP